MTSTLLHAAVSHLSSSNRDVLSAALELEQLPFFVGADASTASSSARLVSAASIEERVKADTADACAAAESLIAMDEMLIQARSRLDGMIR